METLFSSRRFAQVGLGAASLVLVASVAVLLSGASDSPSALPTLGVTAVAHGVQSPAVAAGATAGPAASAEPLSE